MKQVSKVLVRTIVKEFYKEHVGFFLVVLGLGFGFLKTPQHKDIAGALAFNPTYYLIPFGLWVLYTLKTLSFCERIKKLSVNWIFTESILLKPSIRKPLFIYIQALLLVPILGYSSFQAIIAFQLGQIFSATLVIAGNLLILLVSAHLLHHRILRPVDAKTGVQSIRWTRLIPRNYPMLLVHHLLQRHGLGLILIKLFSCAIVIGATLIYQVQGTDLRYLSLGVLLSAGANATLTFRHVEFKQKYLTLFENLPISSLSIFLKDLATYLVLSLPEILVLTGNNWSEVPAGQLISISLLWPGLLICYRGIVSATHGIDGFMKYVFFITVILFFTVLGYVSSLFITGAGLLAAYVLRLKYPDQV